jgi:hypothetical protein
MRVKGDLDKFNALSCRVSGVLTFAFAFLVVIPSGASEPAVRSYRHSIIHSHVFWACAFRVIRAKNGRQQVHSLRSE